MNLQDKDENIKLRDSASAEGNDWINALDKIMRQGWNAIIDENYIEALRTNLGLKINTTKKYAYDIFKVLVKELFEINKFELIPYLMVDPKNINNEPNITSVNKICWSISMDQKVGSEIKEFLGQYKKNTKLNIDIFEKDFYKHFNKNIWKKDFDDVINSLRTLKLAELEFTSEGLPKKIIIN